MRDIDIRRVLAEKMKSQHSGEPDTLIVHELGVCQGAARVDLAVINGQVHGYEIKSDRDTLYRLQDESKLYSQALEYVSIIGALNHLAGIEAVVPPWWGIWSATQDGEEVRLELLRPAVRNPSLLPLALAQFLWRDEALGILTDKGMQKGLGNKSRHHLWTRLTECLTLDELGAVVRTKLKVRGGDWRALG